MYKKPIPRAVRNQRELKDVYEWIAYQIGFEEGRVTQARRMIRLVGEVGLGTADPQTINLLENIADITKLEGLCSRILTANSWEEVFE